MSTATPFPVRAELSGDLSTAEEKRRTGGKSSDRRPTCRHCGAPLIDERMVEAGFCCAGCSYVYRMVHEQGLAGMLEFHREMTAVEAEADVIEQQPPRVILIDMQPRR